MNEALLNLMRSGSAGGGGFGGTNPMEQEREQLLNARRAGDAAGQRGRQSFQMGSSAPIDRKYEPWIASTGMPQNIRNQWGMQPIQPNAGPPPSPAMGAQYGGQEMGGLAQLLQGFMGR